jgi:hypothetical protein
MGDEVAAADAQLATQVGFSSAGLPVSLPAPHDFAQAVRPGLQALAEPEAGDAGPDGLFHPRLEAVFNPALYAGAPNVGGVHWSFGDGSHATTGYLLTANGQRTPAGRPGPAWVDHGFRPGRTYPVTLTATDANGSTATWRLDLTAYPRLRAAVRALPARNGRVRLVAGVRGGDGHLVAAHWDVDGRRVGNGDTVVVARRLLHAMAVTVVDGTGGTATARVGTVVSGPGAP